MSQAGFALRGRNPDVLTCIANLSNDEVFTPPDFANQMLDEVAAAWARNNGGANIWADKSVRFLDPFTKSGVFLREITKRLVDGLAGEIPDLSARVDHILTKQVFGRTATSACRRLSIHGTLTASASGVALTKANTTAKKHSKPMPTRSFMGSTRRRYST